MLLSSLESRLLVSHIQVEGDMLRSTIGFLLSVMPSFLCSTNIFQAPSLLRVRDLMMDKIDIIPFLMETIT